VVKDEYDWTFWRHRYADAFHYGLSRRDEVLLFRTESNAVVGIDEVGEEISD
jgi:hypothetical protein